MSVFDQGPENYILTAQCSAGVGIVAAISGYFADKHCYICALGQLDSPDNGNFFLRMMFKPEEESPGVKEIKKGFKAVAQSFDMQWQLHSS